MEYNSDNDLSTSLYLSVESNCTS